MPLEGKVEMKSSQDRGAETDSCPRRQGCGASEYRDTMQMARFPLDVIPSIDCKIRVSTYPSSEGSNTHRDPGPDQDLDPQQHHFSDK